MFFVLLILTNSFINSIKHFLFFFRTKMVFQNNFRKQQPNRPLYTYFVCNRYIKNSKKN